MTAATVQKIVIDLMVEKFQGLTYTGLVPAGETVSVFDGEVDGTTWPNVFVVVMSGEDGDTAGRYNPAYLGTTSEDEYFDVHVGTFAYIGGSAPADVGPANPSDAQAVARANADIIHEALVVSMKLDRNLRTQNGGLTAPVLLWEDRRSAYSQQYFADEGAMGRYATWRDVFMFRNVVT